MHQAAMRSGYIGQLSHILQHAGFVVGAHERDQSGVGAQRRLEGLRRKHTIGVDPKTGDRESLVLSEVVKCVEHRVVFRLASHQVPALVGMGARKPQNGEVVGFRA
jgi:hypothetical protein